ncbi:GTPase IMAP family member 9-like [Colossoma macropomum]|uniref:GTPase IMAP family member 9-like n=1 Tax=Colossoma macropomum TaxID=42526 RepID=UPI0018644F5B|nr:GTPase IMAP family member 9-like [Colossoma macropomum]
MTRALASGPPTHQKLLPHQLHLKSTQLHLTLGSGYLKADQCDPQAPILLTPPDTATLRWQLVSSHDARRPLAAVWSMVPRYTLAIEACHADAWHFPLAGLQLCWIRQEVHPISACLAMDTWEVWPYGVASVEHHGQCRGSGPNELNIILLGRSGDGKSSAKNTILGEKSAQVWSSATSLVNQYQAKTRNLQEKTLRIVETPGLFDTSNTKEEFQQEVEKCIAHCAPGLHAFIIILKVGRYSKQEARILEEIKELFGEGVLKNAILLFTNGDQLDDGQTIEEFVQQSVALQDLVNKCGGRVHVIDNKYWKQEQDGYRSNRVQVEKLLNTVEEMVKENGGQYYGIEMLQAVKKNKRSVRLIRLFENLKKYTQGKGWAAVVLASVLLVGVYFHHSWYGLFYW